MCRSKTRISCRRRVSRKDRGRSAPVPAAFAEGLSCAHREPDQIVGLRGVISARQRGPFALGHDDALRHRRWRQLEQRPRQLARRRRRVKIGRVAEQRGGQPALGETGEERFVARRGLTGGNCLHASGFGDREAQPVSELAAVPEFLRWLQGRRRPWPTPPVVPSRLAFPRRRSPAVVRSPPLPARLL